MACDTRLVLKRVAAADRWESQERGDYNLEHLDREFTERLYSDAGNSIRTAAQNRSSGTSTELAPRALTAR
jgi:hypothetical protein